MRHLVVHGIGEGRGLVLVDGHGGVVGEVGLVHHLEHVVTADLSKKENSNIRNLVGIICPFPLVEMGLTDQPI